MTIALAIACAIFAIVLIIRAVASAAPSLPLWPTREEMRLARPHECRLCCVSYTRAWQLDQHNTFHHPRPDIEDSRVEDRS